MCYQIGSDMGFNLLLNNLIGQILQPWFFIRKEMPKRYRDVLVLPAIIPAKCMDPQILTTCMIAANVNVTSIKMK